MTVKTIAVGVLYVAYEEYGEADGWPCVMGHGFPDDASAYAEAAPILAATRAHVIVPYLRGFGPTRFLSADTPRSGEQVALGADFLALMDALDIERPAFEGQSRHGRATRR